MYKIYYNPKCSKCRTALAGLEACGIQPEIITYLDGHVTADELREVLEKLKMRPTEIIRTKEDLWKENFAGKDLSDDQLIDILVANPKLIERPIIVKGDKAVVARSDERIREIIEA